MRRARTIHGIRISLLPALVAALMLALAGCGANVELPGGGDDQSKPDKPLISDSASPNYVLTVNLESGDTIDGIEATYGGDVLVWEADDYALLGLESAPVDGDPAYGLIVEPNDPEFLAAGTISMNGDSDVWASGKSTIWAGGKSTIWAGGKSTIWAGGEYQWIPENNSLWAQVALEQAHGLASNLGLGVKVAVIDTGVDLEHPALKEALAPTDEWWDFVDNDDLPQEVGVFGKGGYGHGTNVAGIIRQVAPRATILPIRVLGSDGQGNVADLAVAIDWAVTMGAEVINLSLGADKHISTVDKALKRAAADGVFVVNSVGNDNLDVLAYPSRSADQANPGQREHILSVGSVDAGDVRSFFSNYSKKLELSAPGENVYGPAPEERMASWSGTSMAAPMAAGALALALGESLAVDKGHLAEFVKTTSFDIYGVDGNSAFAKHGELGEGRLDIHKFLLGVVAGGDE